MRRWAAFAAMAVAWVCPLSAAEHDASRPATLMAERISAHPDEVFADLARAHGLGYVEMVAANPGLDPWRPPAGSEVLLPTVHLPPVSDAPLAVNLGDMRLYYTAADGRRYSFPVGIGREGRELRPGTVARVVRKRENPTWVPPASIRAVKPWLPASVPPGPDNPLGEFSLDLDLGLIRIHGTNRPDGVGRRVSNGCIRLYPEDIARLFAMVPVGTTVAILDQPTKLAWLDGDLWLEVHPSQRQADAVEERHSFPHEDLPELEPRVAAAAGAEVMRIDWGLVAWAEETRLGVPVRVTRPAAGTPVGLVAATKERPGGHAAGP